jgi:hypothetical protein
MPTSSLHPRIVEIIDVLESSHRELVEVVTSMPAARRDAPSADGRWSVAQNLEHLASVEEGVGRLITKRSMQLAESGARETDDTPVGHSLDHFQVWTKAQLISAPEAVHPTAGLHADEALARLTVARTRLIDAFRDASGLPLASVEHLHPALGLLNLYQWGILAAHHELRHLAQIREVAGLTDA